MPARWREAAAAELAPLLAGYEAGDLFRSVSGSTAYREWQFAYRLPDPHGAPPYLFTGRIDCILDYGDGRLGIVDYKTDRVAAGDAAAKAKEYTVQMVLYALAVEAAGLGSVRDARLHFLRPGVTVTVDLHEAARAAAVSAIASVCRHVRAHGDESAYPCNTSACRQCGYRVLCPGYKQ